LLVQNDLQHTMNLSRGLDLSEVLQCWVDRFEGLIDLFTDLRAGNNNFSTDEDQQNDLWFDHSIDKAREEFRFIRAERMMLGSKTLQSNGELDVT